MNARMVRIPDSIARTHIESKRWTFDLDQSAVDLLVQRSIFFSLVPPVVSESRALRLSDRLTFDEFPHLNPSPKELTWSWISDRIIEHSKITCFSTEILMDPAQLDAKNYRYIIVEGMTLVIHKNDSSTIKDYAKKMLTFSSPNLGAPIFVFCNDEGLGRKSIMELFLSCEFCLWPIYDNWGFMTMVYKDTPISF